jgi:hypothetical protein
MVAPPAPGVNLHKTIIKGNIVKYPSSVCEIVHKINCLHKSPRLADLSLQQKEGKNEKDLHIHNNFDGTDNLHVISGPDI